MTARFFLKCDDTQISWTTWRLPDYFVASNREVKRGCIDKSRAGVDCCFGNHGRLGRFQRHSWTTGAADFTERSKTMGHAERQLFRLELQRARSDQPHQRSERDDGVEHAARHSGRA